ncbi:MAG: hypothetical protein F6K14_10505 [Symploca sp. SIO2C1]|nr:hypothetical protein [Symploca sp. SIO2C1]
MADQTKFVPLELGKPVQLLPLAELDEAAALELLKSLTEAARIDAELEDAKELCRRLGYLPLGLELVGRYLAQRKGLSLTEMLARLAKKGLTHKSLDKPKDEITAKLEVKGRFYDGQGLYELAEPWFEECRTVAATHLGKEHPVVQETLAKIKEESKLEM